MKNKALLMSLHLVVSLCLFLSAGFWPDETTAADNPVDIHLFWSQDCPHCLQEKVFLAKLQAQYPQVRVHLYEISRPNNQELLEKAAERLHFNVIGVPVTIIGDRYVIGWLDESTTGAAITAAVKDYSAGPYTDLVGNLVTPEVIPAPSPEKSIPETMNLPIFGKINTRNVSLPLFTIMMGAVDGFNPCAMWVLVFLIGLLVGLGDRRRMWILGGTFIAASAGIYFLFMTAWLNLLLFLGLIFWVRIIIGVVALTAGFYNLKEYFTTTPGICKVTKSDQRQRVFQKLKDITQQQKFWLALGGIIALAFVVNLVELICSASLPVVYLQVLTMNKLPNWQYYLYISFYILIFMLDDLVVYIVAMTTLQVTGLTGKYSHLSYLFGGLAMITIGFLIILKPEWLRFG